MVPGSVAVRAPKVDPLREPRVVRDLADRYLLWDAFVAGRRRVESWPLVLAPWLHEEAVRAAEGSCAPWAWRPRGAHADSQERARYGFDDDTLRLASASHAAHDDASLMRVDLLLDASGGWKACEVNADCPGGHNETLALPRLARAGGFGQGRDPTRVVDGLAARLRKLADGGAVGIVHATGYAEDLQVCALVARVLRALGTRVVLAPPTAPALRGGDLCIEGEPVRALYRYFPTEWMSGQSNVLAIARAVEQGKVRTLTGFGHVFAQSKLAFARAWQGGDEEARRWLPETRPVLDVDRGVLAGGRADWVIKRAMGRVGEEVFVGYLFRRRRRVGGARRRRSACALRAGRVVDRPALRATAARRDPLRPAVPHARGLRPRRRLRGVLRAPHAREPCLARRALCPGLRRVGGVTVRALRPWAPVALLASASACAARQTPAASLETEFGDWAPSRAYVLPSRADLLQRWTLPADDPWSPYCKYTLMTSLGETEASTVLPGFEGLDAVQRARAAAHHLGVSGLPENVAWIVDLRGAASVTFGTELSRSSDAVDVSLIPTFNNWPAANEVVPAEETLAALAAMTPASGAEDGSGTPVFLLDAWRLAHRYDEPEDDTYDNRYTLGPGDLPEAATLRVHGFDRVAYVVDSLADTTVEEDDLNSIFRAYEAAGIQIAMIDLDDLLNVPEIDPWQRILAIRDLTVGPRETILSGPSFYVRARGGFGGVRARPSPIAIGHGGGAWWHGGGG